MCLGSLARSNCHRHHALRFLLAPLPTMTANVDLQLKLEALDSSWLRPRLQGTLIHQQQRNRYNTSDVEGHFNGVDGVEPWAACEQFRKSQQRGCSLKKPCAPSCRLARKPPNPRHG
ncbi:hypothetical protein CCHR01_05488 [Colletotrichum chrysophilum]|uniref:Uncharacterized protein n=1 Tax=Colletotrichum chrysophilum TaxID=1836956 RepID=A0AAD9APY9_9PEZI|nr:hypothetical protein CCHR01_05488 [Colletotrichum chrysophilum]